MLLGTSHDGYGKACTVASIGPDASLLFDEGSQLFPLVQQDQLVPMHACLYLLTHWWLNLQHLAITVPWTLPPPRISAEIDASKEGLGYQALSGIQYQGSWSISQQWLHINVREFMVPVLFLQHCQSESVEHLRVCLHGHPVTVSCNTQHGSTPSEILLVISENLFDMAHEHCVE